MCYNLVDRFTYILQKASEVGGNIYLSLLKYLVEEIEADTRDELDEAKSRLETLLLDENMALDEHLSRKFIEELGEAHFHVVSKRSGLDLSKIPTCKDKKTPDFKFCGDPTVYFEVKTPSVAGGDFGIGQVLEDSWQGRINLENQVEEGQRVALAEQVISPYGKVPYEYRLQYAITVLQNKIRNNVKQKQFSMGSTFLVCSLLVLHPYCGRTNGILRPVFKSYTDDIHYVSGHLWMTAFSQPGMIIHFEPDFEGCPAIAGKIDNAGILIGDEFNFVNGIIFVIYDLSGYSRMLCLVRSIDELTEPVLNLVGHGWNDSKDSNGWRLESEI